MYWPLLYAVTSDAHVGSEGHTCQRAQLLQQEVPVVECNVQLVVYMVYCGLQLTHHIILAAQIRQQRSPAFTAYNSSGIRRCQHLAFI